MPLSNPWAAPPAMLALLLLTTGCVTPTTDPAGPTLARTCDLSPDVPAGQEGIVYDCLFAGSVDNQIINPLSPGDSSCGVQSHTLFEQEVSASVRLIYGLDGVEDTARTRLGGSIAPGGSHRAMLAKSAPPDCSGTIVPAVPVTTSFGGTYLAMLNKDPDLHCLYQSQLTLAPFSQSVQVGLNVNISASTRAAVEADVHRMIDREVAVALNQTFNADRPITQAFLNRNGRCADGWVDGVSP